MSYSIDATFSNGMSYLVDSTTPEVLVESLSYVTTVIEASSKSSKKSKLTKTGAFTLSGVCSFVRISWTNLSPFSSTVSLAKSAKAETVSENSGKSAKSSATEETFLIEPRSIGVEKTPVNFLSVDFTRIADVGQSDPAIEDASSGAIAVQITSILAFLAFPFLF